MGGAATGLDLDEPSFARGPAVHPNTIEITGTADSTRRMATVLRWLA
jgi:hypothetical protein